MLKFLIHVYNHAEVYTIVLSWICIPLGFYATYRFFNRNFAMFTTSELKFNGKDK